MKELRIAASLENLDEVQEFIRRELDGYHVPKRTMSQIDVCVEEIFVNIANYAYLPERGEAVIGCEVKRQNVVELMIRFSDWGKPFNPLEKEDADVTLSAEERQIGGLGIFMVKKIMERVEYQYEDNRNILTMWKYIDETG